jgi:D-alanine-D-alanine ligase-like ATP-grasp enzyme
MFGFMEKREDHGTLIASIDAVLPVIVTAAVAPSSYRPFIMGSSMISATCRRAMKGLGVLRQAALDAVADRKKQVEDGVADRYDLLQQMMDIAQDENGKKVDYGYSEISCHCWSNMYAPPSIS